MFPAEVIPIDTLYDQLQIGYILHADAANRNIIYYIQLVEVAASKRGNSLI